MKSFKTAALLLTLLVCPAIEGATIRLKNRAINALSSPGAVTDQTANIPHEGHWIVQFSEYPNAETRREVMRRGGRVIDYVPDFGLMIEFPAPTSLQGMGVEWIGQLAAEDKLSAGLDTARAYLVIFHHDISDAAIQQILSDSPTLPADGLMPGHRLIDANPEVARALATRDEVAYIEPGTAEMTAQNRGYRCGGPETEAGAIGEYALVGSGWPKDANGNVTIGYYFEVVTQQLDANQVKSEIERAFAEWQRYANITIQPAAQEEAMRSIDVLFATGSHGDAYPFTSTSVLAHTFYPTPVNPDPVAGDMHFNDSETWAINPTTGGSVDVFSVALHEAGHALGLGHSTVPTAVMYPYYKMATGLTSDDIAAIQALYGPPASSSAATPTPTPTPSGSGSGSTANNNSGSGTTSSSTGSSATNNSGSGTTSNGSSASNGSGSGTTSSTNGSTATNNSGSGTAGTTNGSGATNNNGSGSGTPSGSDTTPPQLAILSPSASIFSTTASTVTVTGTASDKVGVASIKWSTSNGDAGTASGTTNWSASIPVYSGTNVITVRAFDAAGNSSWRAVTVVKQ